MYVKGRNNKESSIFILHLNSKNSINCMKKLFIKNILKRYYDISIDLSTIYYNQYKKPYIKDIYFNYSHTSKFIALIVGYDEVGIDIENIRPISDIMIDKIMNKSEIKEFNSNSSHSLLEYWVSKEAYVKYIGTGINCDFSELDLKKLKKHIPYSSVINQEYCMYAFSKNKINKYIHYFHEDDFN